MCEQLIQTNTALLSFQDLTNSCRHCSSSRRPDVKTFLSSGTIHSSVIATTTAVICVHSPNLAFQPFRPQPAQYSGLSPGAQSSSHIANADRRRISALALFESVFNCD